MMSRLDRPKRKDRVVTKQVRRRRVLFLALIAISCYFIYSIIVVRVNISREKQALDLLSRQVADQALINEELERVVYSDGEKEYIERIAREKLGYAAIDERIFVDLAGTS